MCARERREDEAEEGGRDRGEVAGGVVSSASRNQAPDARKGEKSLPSIAAVTPDTHRKSVKLGYANANAAAPAEEPRSPTTAAAWRCLRGAFVETGRGHAAR